MSVAVQHAPGLPIVRCQRFNTSPRSHPRPAQSTPGLIRLPILKQQSPPPSPPRTSRSRNRKGKAAEDKDETVDVGSDKDGLKRQQPPPQYKDKEQLPKYPGRKPATRRSASHVPKSRNKLSQAETSSPSDSDSSPTPPTPSPRKTRPSTAPSTPAQLDAAPTGRLARSRRAKFGTPAVAIRIDASNPPAYSILSRSVPTASVPALPDWDSPPLQSPRTVSAPWNSAPSTPTEPEGPISWMGDFGDDTVPAVTAPKPTVVKPYPVAQIQFPTSPPSPPRRSVRPLGRHTRTASSPTIGFSMLARDEEDRPMFTPDGKLIKYAGSRFQSAPAPTFIPMPSFAA